MVDKPPPLLLLLLLGSALGPRLNKNDATNKHTSCGRSIRRFKSKGVRNSSIHELNK